MHIFYKKNIREKRRYALQCIFNFLSVKRHSKTKGILPLIKKKTKIFFIYKEIQKEAVAKSYMTNGLLIYD